MKRAILLLSLLSTSLYPSSEPTPEPSEQTQEMPEKLKQAQLIIVVMLKKNLETVGQHTPLKIAQGACEKEMQFFAFLIKSRPQLLESNYYSIQILVMIHNLRQAILSIDQQEKYDMELLQESIAGLKQLAQDHDTPELYEAFCYLEDMLQKAIAARS